MTKETTESPVLPIKLINWALNRFRYPALLFGSINFFVLLGFYFSTGSMYPDQIEPFSNNPIEMTGVLILLAVMPAYMVMCILHSTRMTNRVIKGLKESLGDQYFAISPRYQSAKYWPIVLIICVIYSWMANINWEPLSFDFADSRFWISFQLVFGQLYMWAWVSILLFFGVLDSIHLHRLGKITAVDLYELDTLNGFGRVASNWFLIIVGSMAITTIQSLDQNFDLERYVSALVVVIPSILILVPMPIWSIHQRMRVAKTELMNRIDAEIREANREFNDEALHRMNGLMLRRDHIHKMRTWPMDLSIFSRFILYVFIPPLAWAGAAFMEFYLDGMLGG